MSFIAVLFALILEQARPLGRSNWVHAGMRLWARLCSRNLDAGQTYQGWMVWTAVVLFPALLALAVHLLLWDVHGLLAFAWSVGILYVTLGFRQFSHHFTHIRDALEDGNEPTARQMLAQWQQVDASELPRSEIVRHVIEFSVLSAHRHVFGVLAWFSVLAAFGLGPAGAVLYRMAEFVARYWVYKSRQKGVAIGEGASPALQLTAIQAWQMIDYLPARITALGFAVVGSFEDAIDAWRNYNTHTTPPSALPMQAALNYASRSDGILLAATSGAVNLRLGGQMLKTASAIDEASTPSAEPVPDSRLGMGSVAGREPEVAHLRSIVGLVWRSVVLWMAMLALLTLARLLG